MTRGPSRARPERATSKTRPREAAPCGDRPSALVLVIAIAAAAATLGGQAGCGGGLKYTVDDAAMDPIPSEERVAVAEARKDLESAEGEKRAALADLEALERERSVADSEGQQAELEVEKAVAQQEGARASRNENDANAAAHSKALADLGLDAAKAKRDWMDARKAWNKRRIAAADAHVEAASARVELEKAKVAKQKGVKLASEIDPSDYESQWKGKNASWRSEKGDVEGDARAVQAREQHWKELTRQQQSLRGAGAGTGAGG